MFLDENKSPICGTDGTFITELKTLTGIKNRFNSKGFVRLNTNYRKYCIILPYTVWKNTNTAEIAENINKYILRYGIYNISELQF
jgi:hypothetical protein